MGFAHKFELWSHVSDVENHLAKCCLKWRTPLDCFTGETPVPSLLACSGVVQGENCSHRSSEIIPGSAHGPCLECRRYFVRKDYDLFG